jgi:ABC-type transporter Mla MlaB component
MRRSRAQAGRDDLIVAAASCNVYAGVGDPYLPFRDILGMLSGDVEALWKAGEITRDHALRLWHVLPYTANALLDSGPDLIETFLPGKALRERLAAYGSGELERLLHLQRGRVRSGELGPDQTRLFEEYSAVLAALAARQPLCLVLDDLHWADASSLSLLFHLGRRLKDSRVLILGTYRPEDVALYGKARPLGLTTCSAPSTSISSGVE